MTCYRPSVIAALLTLVTSISLPPAVGHSAQSATCDGACLSRTMADFLKAMNRGQPIRFPLAENAEIRENTKLVSIAGTSWKNVKAVKSVMTFPDPVTGNVVSRAGVELADGKLGYISTRLKIVPGGRITYVELSSDICSRVVADYVWKLDPQFSALLPWEQRMSRVDLEALARRYCHSLSTHVATATDFDNGCDRYHSGQRITNTARNAVESACLGHALRRLKNVPWGPATEQRFPVIDAQRGIVVGITLLHYPKRCMYRNFSKL